MAQRKLGHNHVLPDSSHDVFTRVLCLPIHYALRRFIRIGTLRLVSEGPGGDFDSVVTFGEEIQDSQGESSADCKVVGELLLLDPRRFYTRIATQADIGLAESYMYGEVEASGGCEGLKKVLKVLVMNREAGGDVGWMSWMGRFGNWILGAGGERNSLRGASRRNISGHYDLSNRLFGLFLGRTWVYSCAIFSEGNDRDGLDEAQWRKLDKIIQLGRINETSKVLDIGSGWGEFGIRAAKTTGCHVTGITLSMEQLALSRQRAERAGVADRVNFKLLDYRDLPGDVKYDCVVSIEMLEAVGPEYLPDFFAVLERVLRPKGLVVLQVITTPEPRYKTYLRGTDFIQKHIFPGSCCPSVQALISAMASSSNLIVEHLENIGPHYATTLRAWRERFQTSIKSGEVAAAGFDEVFIRKWLYYFCYCEVGFATRTLGDMQMLLTRPNNVQCLGGPPVPGARVNVSTQCAVQSTSPKQARQIHTDIARFS